MTDTPDALARELERCEIGRQRYKNFAGSSELEYDYLVPGALAKRILTALRPSTRDAVADGEGVDDFIEEWSDCGNFGWCGREGKCTRHNCDEYRQALKAFRTANTGRAEVLEEGLIERSAFNDMANFAADERDRTILLSGLLEEARWYVNDSLEAHEHSDGRELLNRIDAALSSPPVTTAPEENDDPWAGNAAREGMIYAQPTPTEGIAPAVPDEAEDDNA